MYNKFFGGNHMEQSKKAPQIAEPKEEQKERIVNVTIANMVRYRDMLSSFVYELDRAIERFCIRNGVNTLEYERSCLKLIETGRDSLPEEISNEAYQELYDYVERCLQYSPFITVKVLNKHVKIVQR